MYEVDKIESLPESKFERALALKTKITTVAEGGTLDQPVYMLLRRELADDPATKRLLPKFVLRSYDHGAILSEMKDVHSGGGAYAARRNFFCETSSHLSLNILRREGVQPTRLSLLV